MVTADRACAHDFGKWRAVAADYGASARLRFDQWPAEPLVARRKKEHEREIVERLQHLAARLDHHLDAAGNAFGVDQLPQLLRQWRTGQNKLQVGLPRCPREG